VTTVIDIRSASARYVCWYVAPPGECYYIQYRIVTIILHRRVWYHTLSLCFEHIQSSDIILIPEASIVPNFVSFTASIAVPAYGEGIAYSITHSINQSLTQPI